MTPCELAALHGQCFVTPKPWSAQAFEGLLATQGCFLLTENQLELEGFLLGRVIADEAELLTLAVAPTMRRNGTGRRLVKAFSKQCQTMGATRAFLEVAADNSAARALYRSTGFTEAGTRKKYYTQPDGLKIDAMVMTCALTAL